MRFGVLVNRNTELMQIIQAHNGPSALKQFGDAYYTSAQKENPKDNCCGCVSNAAQTLTLQPNDDKSAYTQNYPDNQKPKRDKRHDNIVAPNCSTHQQGQKSKEDKNC